MPIAGLLNKTGTLCKITPEDLVTCQPITVDAESSSQLEAFC